MTPCIKPEVHSLPHHRKRRTEPRGCAICTKNLLKIGRVFPEICSRTHKQIRSSQYFASPRRAEYQVLTAVCGIRVTLFRAVARIFVRGVGFENRGWGQARPKRPRAGVGFLGRGQPAPSPSARGFLAFYRRQMAFPGITIVQTECVSAHISLDVLFYIAKKFSSQHFGGLNP